MGIVNAFTYRDPILVSSDPIRTLPFATVDIFGFCDNGASPQFLIN